MSMFPTTSTFYMTTTPDYRSKKRSEYEVKAQTFISNLMTKLVCTHMLFRAGLATDRRSCDLKKRSQKTHLKETCDFPSHHNIWPVWGWGYQGQIKAVYYRNVYMGCRTLQPGLKRIATIVHLLSESEYRALFYYTSARKLSCFRGDDRLYSKAEGVGCDPLQR